MAWSPNRSSGKGRAGSPFFTELSPPPLRPMLALSAAAHMALVIAALVVSPLFRNPIHLEPVAVVDLIGGGEFRREAVKPQGPAPPAAESEKPPPRSRTASAPPPAKRGKAAKADLDEFTPSKRRTAEIASLTERLRKMREARAGSEAVRGAVEERRTEAAARAAVRRVGERVAHRIEAPAPAPARSGARGTGGGGGAKGTVRVSPELSDYFRRLEVNGVAEQGGNDQRRDHHENVDRPREDEHGPQRRRGEVREERRARAFGPLTARAVR